VIEDETRKQLAAGSDEQGFTFHASFDPFNMIMQQLGKLDIKIDDLRKETDAKIEKLNTRFDRMDAQIDDLRKETDVKLEKLDTRFDRMDAKIDGLRQELHSTLDAKIDGLHRELHSTSHWIIGTIVAVAGVAVALASWLLQ
jgi:flagellar capping protein FliD